MSKIKSIVFVCTGNICRSPLAEAQLRGYAEAHNIANRLRISSAGTYAYNGNTPTYEALEAGRMFGFDLSAHRARAVDDAIMVENDLVLAMTQRHYGWMRREFPQYKNKIYLAMLYPRQLAGESPDETDIPDPIGESVEFYINVLNMLGPVMPVIAGSILREEIT